VEVLKAAGVQKPDFGGTGASMSTEPEDPPVVRMFFGIVADSEEQLLEQVTSVEASLAAAGVVLSEQPMVVSEHPVKPGTGSPKAGFVIDEVSGTLTVDTWAPGWGDVEVIFLPREDGRMTALIASYDEAGTRRERTGIVNRVVVRRAAGSPLGAQHRGFE